MTKSATPPPDGDDPFTVAFNLRIGELLIPEYARAAYDDCDRDPRCEHGRSIYDVHHDCNEREME